MIDHKAYLERAIAEVRHWQATSLEADRYPTSMYDAMVESLERAKHFATLDALRYQLKTIVHSAIDSGPLSATFMPSLYELVRVVDEAVNEQDERQNAV